MRRVQYDLDEDRWFSPCLSPGLDTPSYKHTAPKKLVLPKTFKPLERIDLAPVEFMQALKKACPSDFLPPDLIHSLVVQDAIAESSLRDRSSTWNRLLCAPFGDSRLIVHPSGQDGGRRLCFSRIMPWYETMEEGIGGLNTRWQCIPSDCADWNCGFSPIRHLLYDQRRSRVYAMNAEAVCVFCVASERDDPVFLYRVLNPNPEPLIDCCPVGNDRFVLLSENGSVNVAGGDDAPNVLCEDSGYHRLCPHPLGSPFHFLAATENTLFILDIKKNSSLQLCKAPSIVAIASIDHSSLFMVSTDQALLVYDLASLPRPLFEWSNSLCFSSPIHRISSRTLEDRIHVVASTDHSSHIIELIKNKGCWNASFLPQRTVLPVDRHIVGTDFFIEEEMLTSFAIYADSTVLYNVQVNSDDGCILQEPYDPIKGHGRLDYQQTCELESSLKPSNNFIHKLFPDDLEYLNYSFVWNWLWSGRAEAASPVVPAPCPVLFGLGSHVTEEIARVLLAIPGTEPVLREAEVQMSEAAAILNARWA